MNMDVIGRVNMTLSCNDCESIPKVPDAGRISMHGNDTIQTMHNGLKVVAGGYYGDWMAQIIRGLRGHHEPQEELAFHHLLKYIRHNSTIVELGAFWSYYSLWFLQEIPGSRAIAIEPDPAHIIIGQKNAALNHFSERITYHQGWVGGKDTLEASHICETTGLPLLLPSFDMNRIAALLHSETLELLHIDAQGAELDFIHSLDDFLLQKRLRFLVASTHHRAISGSATTHEDCLEAIKARGGLILLEHNVQESYSGDGLIIASFNEQDANITLPPIHRNLAETSLFPVP